MSIYLVSAEDFASLIFADVKRLPASQASLIHPGENPNGPFKLMLMVTGPVAMCP